MDKKFEKKNEYFTDEDYLDMTGSSSATDCTGLIPDGSNRINAYDDYNDLYQYGIPHVDAKSSAKSINKSYSATTGKSAGSSSGKSTDESISKNKK